MTSIPTYTFPSFSPILVVGFLGIAVSLYTLYTVNKAIITLLLEVSFYLIRFEKRAHLK